MTVQTGSVREKFPPETLDALFEAVEVDDVVDPEVSLPHQIDPGCSRDEMRRCFELCFQFWSEGASRPDLLQLVNNVLRNHALTASEQRQFKYIRAKYKHLRFALVLYDARHRAPALFRATVRTMGHLQDAFRNKQHRAIIGYGLALRALLSRPIWMIVRRRVSAITLDSADGFAAYRRAEIHRLEKELQRKELSGEQFHDIRKIVSQQVSFYDTLRTLYPSDDGYRMSRFLSAINGLMGRRHDEMIEQAMAGQKDYGSPTPLDADILGRLERLVAHYPH